MAAIARLQQTVEGVVSETFLAKPNSIYTVGAGGVGAYLPDNGGDITIIDPAGFVTVDAPLTMHGRINTDVSGLLVVPNAGAGLTFSWVGDRYLQESVALSVDDIGDFTPAFSIATPGDLAVAYATQAGRYVKRGSVVRVWIDLECTPTFTTAAGDIVIEGLPAAARAGFTYTLSVNAAGGYDEFGSVYQIGAVIDGTTLKIQGSQDANDQVAWEASKITGTDPFVLRIAGEYETA